MFGHLLPRLAVTALAILFSLLPVAAGERFRDNGDGTVTDHEFGLMWSKTDNNGNINWIQAEKWVKYTFPLTLKKKYDNWRLPTLKELQSLEVSLGSAGVFNMAGIDRSEQLKSISFTLMKENGKNVIRLKTEQPFRDPFLHFIINATWANGSMLREYTSFSGLTVETTIQ